jgi:predicted amino acid-binding ACT domain protein
MTSTSTSYTAGNDSALNAAAAASSIQAAMASNGSKGSDSSGLMAAVMAILAYVEALNGLQKVTADQASSLALMTKEISDAENSVLEKDQAGIDAAAKETGTQASADLTAASKQYSTDQTEFNNYIATPQSLTESFQNGVSDISQTTTSDYQNLGQLIAIWSNLASIMH